MTESDSDPFWLHQPWRVLTDILDLQKISPWEINLTELVNGFMGRLLATEYLDLRICGRALLSAAILLRFKTEYLIEFGREEEELIREIEEDIFLPPIRPPFRQRVRPTSEAELLEALRELVFPRVKRQRKKRTPQLPSVILSPVDGFHVEMTKSMAQVLERLRQSSREKNPVSFFEFVQGMSHYEIVRVFLSILFLIGEGNILVSQDQKFEDISITFLNAERNEGAQYAE